jgi:hypothetical protein
MATTSIPPAPTELPPAAPVAMATVATATTTATAITVVQFMYDNHVYDVTSFLNRHPGGAAVLKSSAGKEVTASFTEVGHSRKAVAIMKKSKVCSVEEWRGKNGGKDFFSSSLGLGIDDSSSSSSSSGSSSKSSSAAAADPVAADPAAISVGVVAVAASETENDTSNNARSADDKNKNTVSTDSTSVSSSSTTRPGRRKVKLDERTKAVMLVQRMGRGMTGRCRFKAIRLEVNHGRYDAHFDGNMPHIEC